MYAMAHQHALTWDCAVADKLYCILGPICALPTTGDIELDNF